MSQDITSVTMVAHYFPTIILHDGIVGVYCRPRYWAANVSDIIYNNQCTDFCRILIYLTGKAIKELLCSQYTQQ